MQENKNGMASGEKDGIEGDGLRVYLCLDTGVYLILMIDAMSMIVVWESKWN